MKHLEKFLILVISWNPSFGQPSFSSYENYFRDPLNIPIQLSANFGALRSNHFHMGLDIRTEGRENLPVYAVAGGYISRVKIEESGFGKAIYITHPNGFTTVYAHLNKFYDALERFIHQKEYDDESWEQDVTFPPSMFPVVKGQFIAYSGNTGASEGPHLHFEIRDTRTENNLNPLLFGFNVPDKINPLINGVYWYNRKYSTYEVSAKEIPIIKKNGIYTSFAKIVKVNSHIITLGISAEDKTSNSPFLMGIYRAELWMDDSLVNTFSLNNISYSETRYVNACIDYSTWKTSGKYIQHLSVLPGNRMPIFGKGNGIITLVDTLPHKIQINVSDAYGNISELEFVLQFDGTSQQQFTIPRNVVILLPNQENIITGKNVQLYFSKFAFYDTVPFQLYEQSNTGTNKASAFIILHNTSVPVHDSFTIKLKTTLPFGSNLRTKTIMQLVNSNIKSTVKGDWEGDWMTARFNNLGTVQLLIDTVYPEIKTIGWINGQKFSPTTKNIRLLCWDNIDGVKYFSAELDGKWLLFTRKGDYFTYIFDEKCSKGNHKLKVMTTDIAGNTTQKAFSFVKQ